MRENLCVVNVLSDLQNVNECISNMPFEKEKLRKFKVGMAEENETQTTNKQDKITKNLRLETPFPDCCKSYLRARYKWLRRR